MLSIFYKCVSWVFRGKLQSMISAKTSLNDELFCGKYFEKKMYESNFNVVF